MKKCSLLFFVIFLQTTIAFSQLTAREVAEKVRGNCNVITNGKYTLERKFKFDAYTDTMFQNGMVVFEKKLNDTLFGMHFWIENSTDSFAFYYNGNAMHTVRMFKKTVTLDTLTKNMQNGLRGMMEGEYINYPFVKNAMAFLDDTSAVISYAPEWETRKNKDTIIILVQYKKTGGNMAARWYINKNYYPVIKEVTIQSEEGVQWEYFKINDYSINQPAHSTWLRKQNWTNDYDTFYFQPKIIKPTFLKDTLAPNWKAETLAGDSIEFASLHNKLYLIDFWFKGCQPCIKAIPFLQSMHQKYGPLGLHVIGLNPYDYQHKNNKNFSSFLQKLGVEYTVAFIAPKIASDYKVQGFPTLYIINGKGNIIHAEVGYDAKNTALIEKIISDNLGTH